MLIAGGAGITPFLAILNDLLKRHQLKQENKLPDRVKVIWSVRSISEISVLRDIRPALICPSLGATNNSLKLEVEVYVTRNDAVSDFSQYDSKILEFETTCAAIKGAGTQSTVDKSSRTSATLTPPTSSQNLLMVAVILASVAGFVLMSGLFNLYVYTPRNSTESPFPCALDVFLFFISIASAIVVCGGAVLLLWNPAWSYIHSKPHISPQSPTRPIAEDSEKQDLEAQPATLLEMCTITKGSRPRFQGMLTHFMLSKKLR